jgi:hypothetical protein
VSSLSPPPQEEEERQKFEKERAENEAFEKANPDFCTQVCRWGGRGPVSADVGEGI